MSERRFLELQENRSGRFINYSLYSFNMTNFVFFGGYQNIVLDRDIV
jgi:hypothetical protein